MDKFDRIQQLHRILRSPHLPVPLKTLAERMECTVKRTIETMQLQLDAHFAQAYGIFAGEARHTAKLRFDAEISREIAQQQWHPQQVGEWDGRDYLLTLPYSNDQELIQDILRHCPNVYVEAPVALRKKVQSRLQDALGRFVGRVIRV